MLRPMSVQAATASALQNKLQGKQELREKSRRKAATATITTPKAKHRSNNYSQSPTGSPHTREITNLSSTHTCVGKAAKRDLNSHNIITIQIEVTKCRNQLSALSLLHSSLSIIMPISVKLPPIVEHIFTWVNSEARSTTRCPLNVNCDRQREGETEREKGSRVIAKLRYDYVIDDSCRRCCHCQC